jgi:molecular chaperone GrpE
MNDRTNGAPKPGPEQPASSAADAAKGTPSAAHRGGTRAEERIAALDTSAATARVEELEAQLATALSRAEEAEAGWQRARADYANLKRRSEEERADLSASASDRLLLRVLELADDFDLAVEHVPEDVRDTPWVDGIGAIDRKLRSLLEAEGVRPMGTEGEAFDPHTQQAISYEDDTSVPDGTVTRVLQRGYTIRDRVLRPALVAVARNETSHQPDDDDD